MAQKLWRDRVCETTATTGTGTVTGAGAVSQYQSLSAFATGSLVDYTILSGNGTDWETGEGTVTISGGTRTLSRDIIYESSNAGSAISLTGTSTVYCHMSAKRATQAGVWGPVVSRVPTSANTGLTNWLNQGGATVNDRATGITLNAPSSAGDNIRARYKAAPSTPYSFKALIGISPPTLSASNFVVGGIGWHDGTKLHTIDFLYEATLGHKVRVARMNSVTAFSAMDFGSAFFGGSPAWLRIRDDGTTVYFQLCASGDDNDFITVYSVAKASGFLGSSGYANVLFFANRVGTTGSLPAQTTVFAWEQGT